MLQHAVREHLIESVVAKGQVASVGDDVGSLDPQLFGDPVCGANAFEGGIDANRAISHLRGGKAPSSPIAADFQKGSIFSRWQAKPRNWIFCEIANEMLVQPAIGRADASQHKRIDLVWT